MVSFGKKIVKYKIPIFIIGLLLLIPSVFGYFGTRVNYDILAYLPGDIETMKGQDILTEEFGSGAFVTFVAEGMEYKDVSKLKEKIEDVGHVNKVIWYDSFVDISVPVKMLPDTVRDAFQNKDNTLMLITFDTTMSSDETMDAISEIRKLAGKQCFLSGMPAVTLDTKNITIQETPIYVGIAAISALVVLGITMDSFLIPLLFLLSIGIAIVYNLGSNMFLGEISFITKALTAVLQLGVTMDYSIFLWHSYGENKVRYEGDKDRAMAHAIGNTISSVVGSSITTVAGFIALCFMSFTLGLDLGIVMAKGVIIGVICCITILPSMILIFDKALEKTKHKPLLPEMKKVSAFITKHYVSAIIIFVVVAIPAINGYRNTSVYYNLTDTLPETLDSIQANEQLQENFHMNSVHMVLVDSGMESKEVYAMTQQMKQLDGVKTILGMDAILGSGIPREIIPADAISDLKNKNYQMMLIFSEYKPASDEVNKQCNDLTSIIKKYDSQGMLVGEAPCTKDLIDITDKDFKTVSIVSIGVIFLIIAVLFKSISLPVILVAVIEFAIFVNMSVPFYTGTSIPFIASVVIGTIQLGATVDYAILMTTRYKKERNRGKDKKEAISIAHSHNMNSIIVSALTFFAATIGVGLYSKVDMIGSLCTLMSRGAIISMIVVLFILPAMLTVFDKLIINTSLGFKEAKLADKNR